MKRLIDEWKWTVTTAMAFMALALAALGTYRDYRSDRPSPLSVYYAGRACFVAPSASDPDYALGGFATSLIFANPGPQSAVVMIRDSKVSVKFAPPTLTGTQLATLPDWSKLILIGEITGLSELSLYEFVVQLTNTQGGIQDPVTGELRPRGPRPPEVNTPGSVAEVASHDTLVWTPVFLLTQSNFYNAFVESPSAPSQIVRTKFPAVVSATLTVEFDEVNSSGVRYHRRDIQLDPTYFREMLDWSGECGTIVR